MNSLPPKEYCQVLTIIDNDLWESFKQLSHRHKIDRFDLLTRLIRLSLMLDSISFSFISVGAKMHQFFYANSDDETIGKVEDIQNIFTIKISETRE